MMRNSALAPIASAARLCLLLGCFVLDGEARAQGGDPGSVVELIESLDLTDEQRVKFQALEKRRTLSQTKLNELEREELRGYREVFEAERKKALRELLTDEQWKRWDDSWSRQNSGPAAQEGPSSSRDVPLSGLDLAMGRPTAEMPESQFSFLSNYCMDCHDSATEKGGMNLEDLSFQIDTLETAERWQKILNVLNSGEMPPEKKAQPKAAEKTEFLDHLSNQLVLARKILGDSGGVISMRRLNRREYRNTMEALLGIPIDASGLPNDIKPGTFDTEGGSLFFSSDQFEQYFAIAKRTLETALMAPLPKTPQKIREEAEIVATRSVEFRYQSLLTKKQGAEAWLAAEDKSTVEEQFTDTRDAQKWLGRFARRTPAHQHYLALPEAKTGAVLAGIEEGMITTHITIPEKAPPGEYIIRARVGVFAGAPDERRYLEMGLMSDGSRTAEISVLEHRKVLGSYQEPEIVEFAVTVTPTSSRKFVIRERIHNVRRASLERFGRKGAGAAIYPAALWVDWLEWEGPKRTKELLAGRAAIFQSETGRPQDEQRAEEVLRRFADRAFRTSSASEPLIEKLMGLFRARRVAGDSFRQALIEPLATILASPQFIYLSEPNLDTDKRALTGRELAVRLSYFLWSGPPDDRLYALADAGELKQPDVLRKETERMLSDPKAREFVSGFTEQWLHMDRLDFFQFDHRRFPEFDESTRNSARDEVYSTVRTLLSENLRIGSLLKSDFVVIDDLLADYYGIAGVEGSQFRKVAIPDTSPRGGLLGTAAVLAMGSDGERSSPVERGVWMLRYLLHDPPPPAPANVPQLSRLAGKMLSSRQLQQAHMEQPQCAQCHRKIDPLGFGLENFDAAGQWRTRERIVATKKNKEDIFAPIDPAGTMPDKTPFKDYFELRDRIAEREHDFARGFTEALIAYSLGRPYGFTDYNLAEGILSQAKEESYKTRTFVHALVQSETFQQK